MAYETFIARGYLRSKRRRTVFPLITLLGVAGVAVGVMILITVTAVMTGAERHFQQRVLSVSAHLIVMRYGEALQDYEKIGQRIEALDEVVATAPFVYAQGLLRSTKATAGSVIRGIDPNREGQTTTVLSSAILETLAADFARRQDAPGPPGIVLGRELARQLAVAPGDQIFLLSPPVRGKDAARVPAMERLKVLGTIETGLYDFDNSLAYLHLADAQQLTGAGGAVTGIAVRLADIYRADAVKERIAAELGFPYWAKDWMQLYHNMFSALKLQKTVMFIILTLIVLVAALNISGTLFMMVTEKTRDIAILKAMGATDRSIGRIFVLKGMWIGLTGTLLGLAGGFGLCALLQRYPFVHLDPKIYPFTRLPVDVQPADVALIVGFALLICFLATLYPSRRAARLDPVDGFRYA
ncbi:MAG: lipoprotein-releasing ABC transporter permease subunit [Deltaproteobacteria bacterium]|nr:MAG: lipoprotein-releasing ABC transporter permease subunit [Deltaproteobacteria bacterium]